MSHAPFPPAPPMSWRMNPVATATTGVSGERAHVDAGVRPARAELAEVVGEHDDALDRALGGAGGDVGAVLRRAVDDQRVHLVVGRARDLELLLQQVVERREAGEGLLEVGALRP